MGMGDWYWSTNQLEGICERIIIRGLLLWVECEHCVVYERRERWIHIIIYGEVYGGMEEKNGVKK